MGCPELWITVREWPRAEMQPHNSLLVVSHELVCVWKLMWYIYIFTKQIRYCVGVVYLLMFKKRVRKVANFKVTRKCFFASDTFLCVWICNWATGLSFCGSAVSPTRSQCEQFPRFCEPVTKEKVQSGRAFRAIDCQIGELKNCIFLEVIAIILKKERKGFILFYALQP